MIYVRIVISLLYTTTTTNIIIFFVIILNSNRHRNFEIGNFNLNSNYLQLLLGECNFWIYADYIYYMSFQCVKLTQHGRRYVT